MRGRRGMARTEPKEGDLIEVYWPGDKRYYAGKIAYFDPNHKLFRIEYVDGDIENLDLSIEKWRHSGPNYVETASVFSGDEEEEEEVEMEEDNDADEEENEEGTVAERIMRNVPMDDSDEEKVTKSDRKEKRNSSSRSSIQSKLENRPEHAPTVRKRLPRPDTGNHSGQAMKSPPPQERLNGTANHADVAPSTSNLARASEPMVVVSDSAVNRAGASSSTTPSGQLSAATRQNCTGNKDGDSRSSSPTGSVFANRTASSISNKELGPVLSRTSSAPGEMAKGKKIEKQTGTILKSWKRQSRISTTLREHGSQLLAGKRTTGTVVNGHSAQVANGSPAVCVDASIAQRQGAPKRGRMAAESPDPETAKRPRKDAGQETASPIVDNIAHVDMMRLLSLEASKQSIGTAVGPLRAKVEEFGKEHSILMEQQGSMKKCLDDVHGQLSKIGDTWNEQKINEIVSKSILASTAELRTYIKSTIDDSERRKMQAISTLRTHVAQIASDSQKIANNISKMPALVADRVVMKMETERARTQATSNVELKKIVDDAKLLFDKSRHEVVAEMKAYVDQAASNAIAKAANIISATLPNLVSAQLASQMESISRSMLEMHQMVAPLAAQVQALGGTTVPPKSTPPISAAPTSVPSVVGENNIPPPTPHLAAQHMIPPTTLSRTPPQAVGNLSVSDDVPVSLLKTEQSWLKERTAFAKALVGRSATIWLLEDTDRSAPPVQQNLRRTWAKECCTLCFRHVSNNLSKFSDPNEAMRVLNASLCVDDVDLSWFLEPINAASIEKARLNYSTWDPPLCNDEWHAEASVLKELSTRFGVAQSRTSAKASDSALHIAIAITRAAASAEE